VGSNPWLRRSAGSIDRQGAKASLCRRTYAGSWKNIRSEAASEREKGAYFERLTNVWLENTPTQREQFSRDLIFADSA
jgi:hypothetical protein